MGWLALGHVVGRAYATNADDTTFYISAQGVNLNPLLVYQTTTATFWVGAYDNASGIEGAPPTDIQMQVIHVNVGDGVIANISCGDYSVEWESASSCYLVAGNLPTTGTVVTVQVQWPTTGWKYIDLSGYALFFDQSQYNDEDWVDVAVVGVDRIKYLADGTYVDYWGTMHVLKGTSVSFKAIPTPSDAGWPYGKPVWGGTGSGSGETANITFNVKGTQTVTAECGNTVSINVVVHELLAHHGAQEYFTGRNTVKYGVGEKADLWWTVDPDGVTAIQLGGVVWTKASGDGSVSNNGGQNGLGTFTASDTNSTVVVRLTVQSGPSAGKYAEAGFNVTRPTGEIFTLHSTTYAHYYRTASCGFLADIYLLPKDVSFKNIEWGEDDALGQPTGWCLAYYGATPPSHSGYGGITVEGGNIATGCKIHGWDKIFNGAVNSPPAFADGTFLWEIPQQWRLWGSAGAFIPIKNVNQYWTIDGAGTVNIQKDGIPNPPASKKWDDWTVKPIDW
jgi:hypothetical protein